MKTFLFKSISIVSRNEAKAMKVDFVPGSNLIVGMNHTGKSSILKTMYLTMGAPSKTKSKRWDKDTISAVAFSVDGVDYLAIRENERRALFTGRGDLIGVVKGETSWARMLNKATGFNLVLAGKDGNSVLAPPNCFFLPFYIDQDGSWGSIWDTFDNLGRFKTPHKAIMEYFTGIKPPEFYQLESDRRKSQNGLDELLAESKFLERARTRVSSSLSATTPKLSIENFERDVNRLALEVTQLNREQERLRSTSVNQQELMRMIESEISLATAALIEHSKDFKYLMDFRGETLKCPTCGAEHLDSFVEVIELVDDARVLEQLVFKLRRDLDGLAVKHEVTKAELATTRGRHHAVHEVLATKRGDITFEDVVTSLSAETAMKVFDDEWDQVEREIAALRRQIADISGQMKKLNNPVRTREILDQFNKSYHEALIALSLPLRDNEKSALTVRPKLSGSIGPRAVLAYYSAIWATTVVPFGTYRMPFVIDSPNQQGQDKFNMPKILKFIHDGLPQSNQVIVATEFEPGLRFENEIRLETPYSVLSGEKFTELDTLLAPLIILLRTSPLDNA